jgi:hypothetical protein
MAPALPAKPSAQLLVTVQLRKTGWQTSMLEMAPPL